MEGELICSLCMGFYYVLYLILFKQLLKWTSENGSETLIRNILKRNKINNI